MGCYCLQYTVTSSIYPWHHDNPAVCPWDSATTCVATHSTSPRSHFSTRQSSALHDKGVIGLSPNCYYPSLPSLSPDFSPIEHVRDHLGLRVVHPTSLNELEAGLQQIYGMKCLTTSYRTCMIPCLMVSHHVFALEEVHQDIKSSVLLSFSLK
ncbi:uncharacterized protein TNCV_1668411 [Trichonephila clavipes]|nr:uncharacterized protein TNCV_1668411 [Trichonephila clavipes]